MPASGVVDMHLSEERLSSAFVGLAEEKKERGGGTSRRARRIRGKKEDSENHHFAQQRDPPPVGRRPTRVDSTSSEQR